MSHVDPETIHALLDERLPEPEARAARAHLWRCARCRARHEERAALLGALRWYAAEPPAPPPGYWEAFWGRWSIRGLPARARRRSLAPLLAAAAVGGLLVGGWLADRESTQPSPALVAVPPPGAVADSAWLGDYRVYERLTVAIGSVDPLSKGVTLAALAEGP